MMKEVLLNFWRLSDDLSFPLVSPFDVLRLLKRIFY